MNKTIIDRERVHAALDRWLDKVLAHPLRLEDGECHEFALTGAHVMVNNDDDEVIAFTLKISSEEML